MTNRVPKVSIIYPYIAHYRRPVFEKLCAMQDIDYDFWADTVAEVPSLKLMDPDSDVQRSPMYRCWTKLRNHWFLRVFLWQSGLLRRVWLGKSDVYIFFGNMYYASTWVATVLARLRGCKVYYWTHGCRKKEGSLKGLLRKFFYSLADGILLYGHRAKALLVEQGLDGKKQHVIYNSLDYDCHNKLFFLMNDQKILLRKKSLHLPIHCKVIVSAGRLTKDKQIDLLIDAVAKLVNKHMRDVKAIIVGAGPEFSRLQEKILRLEMEDYVVLYGPCYDEQVMAELLYLADVATIPGNIGLFGMHALTFGTPVVTHDNFDTQKPEYEVIQEGVSGGFYQAGDVSSFVNKLLYWIEYNQSRSELREQCRRAIVEKYNPNVQAKLINAIVLSDA